MELQARPSEKAFEVSGERNEVRKRRESKRNWQGVLPTSMRAHLFICRLRANEHREFQAALQYMQFLHMYMLVDILYFL